MGTSSARLGPTGRLWRQAKGAATRYLSPESGGAVDARELAARYVAALGEGSGPGLAGALAAFRQTRKLAQNLGAFCCQARSQGWPTALNAWGLPEPEASAQSLAAALEAPGGGLEQAVAHTALVGVLLNLPDRPGPVPEASQVAQRFLVEAFRLRLSLDLGESLEAAATGFVDFRQGLTGLTACLDQAASGSIPAYPPLVPEDWLGLPGWTWVTGMLEGLISRLREGSP